MIYEREKERKGEKEKERTRTHCISFAREEKLEKSQCKGQNYIPFIFLFSFLVPRTSFVDKHKLKFSREISR